MPSLMLVPTAVLEELKQTDRRTDRQNCALYIRFNVRYLDDVFEVFSSSAHIHYFISVLRLIIIIRTFVSLQLCKL